MHRWNASPFGDLPLIVIARGMPGDFFDPLGDLQDEAETLWRSMQIEMTMLSSNGRLWVAEQSDHGVPMRQPDIVVEAIMELVQEYRRSPRPRVLEHIEYGSRYSPSNDSTWQTDLESSST
jgi:hypothetical protein